MTEAEMRLLIAEGESDRIEFTEGTRDVDKFAEAVCAFANDLPNHGRIGYLLIGVRDDQSVAGIAVNDELLRTLGGWLKENGNIQPLPSITVENVVTSEGDVAVVAVRPADLPPVRYKGRVCIRIGPRRGYATEQEEHILSERRVAHARTFDALPALGSAVDDLSLPLFLIDYRRQAVAAEVIAENERSVEHQLASLRFYDLGSGCPTNAGVLLFGLDVRRFLPGAYIQFLKVDGTSLDAPITNERVIDGDLLTVLRELDALIDAQLVQAPVDATALRERTVEAYPRVAVRELLMNAVMHRDYASTAPLRITWLVDRLEIQSPGGLYGEASIANFPRQTSYRNPVVAEAMKALGYVNRYGRGVIRAQKALIDNGSPEAGFTFDGGYVLATIQIRP